MKTLLLTILISTSALAVDCKVDGISDSPQQYNCHIKVGTLLEKLTLSCKQGVYQMQWMSKSFEVMTAYHEEVEEGSSPLVFVADRLTLTATSEDGEVLADVTSDGKSLSGSCSKK